MTVYRLHNGEFRPIKSFGRAIAYNGSPIEEAPENEYIDYVTRGEVYDPCGNAFPLWLACDEEGRLISEENPNGPLELVALGGALASIASSIEALEALSGEEAHHVCAPSREEVSGEEMKVAPPESGDVEGDDGVLMPGVQ